MRSFFVILILLSLANQIFSQDTNRNQKFSAGFEFRYLRPVSVNADNLRGADFDGTYGKSLRFNLGYFLNPHVYGGLSFGADRYEVASANTFPVTANVRYYLKDQANTFYALAGAGPNISFNENSDKGYSGAIGIGYKFFLFKRTCFTASVGYNYERSKLEGNSLFGDFMSRKSVFYSIGMHF